jgi:hypothetical protein
VGARKYHSVKNKTNGSGDAEVNFGTTILELVSEVMDTINLNGLLGSVVSTDDELYKYECEVYLAYVLVYIDFRGFGISLNLDNVTGVFDSVLELIYRVYIMFNMFGLLIQIISSFERECPPASVVHGTGGPSKIRVASRGQGTRDKVNVVAVQYRLPLR